jgi:hypothetical protein
VERGSIVAIHAYSAFKDGPGDVPTNLSTIGSLSLPQGKFVIFAKLYIAQGSADPKKVQPNQVTARLEAGANFDICVTTVPIASDNPFRSGASAVSLNVVHEFGAGGGTAVVKLDKKPDTTPFLEWAFLKITAIQVDFKDDKPMP